MKLSIEQKKIMDNCFPFAGKAIPLNESQRQCMFAAGEALLDQQAVALTDARWNEMRDAVLNERGSLAEAGLDSDQVNAVLGVIDDYMPAQRTPATASAPQSTEHRAHARRG